MNFHEAMKDYAEEPLTAQILLPLLKNYKRPYDKINEMVKKQELIAVKKGFYIPGPQLGVARPESFLIANHLWGPSYVSLEAALSHWGLIPERVYEISSVTIKAAKSYKTPAGRFSYFHAPLPYYSFGIKMVSLTKRQTILIASAEKAVCDKIMMTSGVILRSEKNVLEFLTEDLRIEQETLRKLDYKTIEWWIEDAPKIKSLSMLIKTLKRL